MGAPTRRRGGGPPQTYLLDENGKRCCVGIHGRLMGVPDEKMLEEGWPVSSMSEEYGKTWNSVVYLWGKGIVREGCLGDAGASFINDDPTTTDEEKIDRLRPIFRERGVTIVWRPDL